MATPIRRLASSVTPIDFTASSVSSGTFGPLAAYTLNRLGEGWGIELKAA